MSASRGATLLKIAIEKLEQQRLWEFYCSVYIHLKVKKPFEEYYKEARSKVRRVGKKELTKEEIITMAEKIRIRHLTQKGKK